MTNSERLLDLLTSRATEGLSPVDDRELGGLIDSQDEFSVEEFELAAAEIDIAFASDDHGQEAMPEMLRHRIIRDARLRFRPRPQAVPDPVPGAKDREGKAIGGWAGWAVAASLLILMIVAPWQTDPVDPVTPNAADLREQLIDTATDLIEVAWATPEIEGYTGVRGDVVWSNASQTGFMRLSGLPENVPSEAQYQLWIVDPTRDANPIDGGVFDIAVVDGEVIVPIDAKLTVTDPQAFAITLEQPGGVVVSDGPLLVVAPVG